MSQYSDPIETLIFDFGNTLVEFTHPHMKQCDSALGSVLERWFGFVDLEEVSRIRNLDRLAPYQGDFRENDLNLITSRLVQTLYREEPSNELLEELLEARFDAFVSAITLPEYLVDLLDCLRKEFRLALLSNYPCGKAIRSSLETIGISHYFDVIVVSADIGHVKPHPLTFEAVTSKLQLKPHQCLFVGDNWLGDIQGAKRLGMQAIHTTQFDTPEDFKPQPGDHLPDGTIQHLLELKEFLKIESGN